MTEAMKPARKMSRLQREQAKVKHLEGQVASLSDGMIKRANEHERERKQVYESGYQAAKNDARIAAAEAATEQPDRLRSVIFGYCALAFLLGGAVGAWLS